MSELTIDQYLSDSKLGPMWNEFISTLDWNATSLHDSDKVPAFERWMIEKAKDPTMTPNGNRFFKMYEGVKDNFPEYADNKRYKYKIYYYGEMVASSMCEIDGSIQDLLISHGYSIADITYNK